MKRSLWFITAAALLLACSGLAAAQCAGNQNPGGFDLLQTTSGTTDNQPGGGLPPITFVGMPLPGGVAGTADTVVCRLDHLPSSIPPQGSPVRIQIVGLLLQAVNNNSTTNPIIFQGRPVNVFATINQTKDANDPNFVIPRTQLPQYDSLGDSSGTMTVFSNGTFNTNSLSIQADIIIVPQGKTVTDTPIKSFAMNSDTMSSSGSTWTTTAPSGYPTSSSFPSGGFFVNEPGGAGGAAVLATSRIVRGFLYGLGVLLLGIAILRIRSSINGGRLTLKPVYLLGLAAIAWFLAWKSSKLTFPTIAHAASITTCVPHTISAWVNEGGGQFVVHKIVTAVCSTTNTASAGVAP